MDYKQFIQDELSKFRLVLNECGVSGDEWRNYMAIKMRQIRGQYCHENSPLWKKYVSRVQPLVRVRNGKVVWFGEEAGDFLAKVPFAKFKHLSVNSDIVLKRLSAPVRISDNICVYFPSENAEIFCPSAECVVQQLPDLLHVQNLLFEVRLSSPDVRRCYDSVLKCHKAMVVLYYYRYPKNLLAARERALPSPEPEDLEVRKVREVNKVKEPEKPNKVIRTPQRLR